MTQLQRLTIILQFIARSPKTEKAGRYLKVLVRTIEEYDLETALTDYEEILEETDAETEGMTYKMIITTQPITLT